MRTNQPKFKRYNRIPPPRQTTIAFLSATPDKPSAQSSTPLVKRLSFNRPMASLCVQHGTTARACGRAVGRSVSSSSSRLQPYKRSLHAPSMNCLQHRRSRQLTVAARAENRGSETSFVTGFVLGGVVFGTLGFLFAPQISRALLGDDQRLKLPRFLEEDQAKDPEQTKQDLFDKIAQLNASIDEVSAQLKAKDEVKLEAAETLKIA